MGITQRALPSSSLAPPAFPPGGISLPSLYGSALPSSGAIFFCPSCCVRCMADMPVGVLSTDPIEYILQLLLRRAPYPPPSDPASQHRAAIVSSSLDQGSPAERISSSLALCQDFGFGFGLVFWPCLRTGPFFCPAARRFNLHQSGTGSANMHSCVRTQAVAASG